MLFVFLLLSYGSAVLAAVWVGRAWGVLAGLGAAAALIVGTTLLPFGMFWTWGPSLGIAGLAQRRLFRRIAEGHDET